MNNCTLLFQMRPGLHLHDPLRLLKLFLLQNGRLQLKIVTGTVFDLQNDRFACMPAKKPISELKTL